MFNKHLLQSIVIGTVATGESDLLVNLLTLQKGKIRCIAKGARKSRKRFMNVLEPFSSIDAVVREPSKTGLFFLESGSLKKGFESLRTNYTCFVMASLCLELIDLWCRERQAEKEIYRLLMWYLEGIENGRDCVLCTLIFKTRLLRACGFLPSLITCHGCRQELSGKRAEYDPGTGQVFCPGCSSSKGKHDVGMPTLKSMDFWQGQSIDKIFRLRINREVTREAWSYLKAVHSNVLEREPKAYQLAGKLPPLCKVG